jgi:Ubiquitin family
MEGLAGGWPSRTNWTDVDWPEQLPPSPNFLRLIHAGKMLADKSPLTDYNIGPGRPNILHLSVRPADFVEDECIPGPEDRADGRRCIQ